MDLKQFARRMKTIAKNVELNADVAVRKAAVVADQVAVTATPVDTGRARANWITTTGSPATGEVDPDESGARGSDARGAANAQRAIDQGEAAIAGWRGESSGSIFITNNVPYAADLDAGSSQQATEGMTAQAIAAASRVARGAKLLKRSP